MSEENQTSNNVGGLVHPVDKWAKWLPVGFQEFFRNKYDSSTDEERQALFKKVVLVSLALFVVVVIFITSNEENYSERMKSKNEKPVTKSLISSERIDSLADEALAKQISDMQNLMESLVKDQEKQAKVQEKEIENLKSRETRLKSELDALKDNQSEDAYQQNLLRLQAEMQEKLKQMQQKQDADSLEIRSKMREKMGNIFYAPNVSEDVKNESAESGDFVLHEYSYAPLQEDSSDSGSVVDKAKELVSEDAGEEVSESEPESSETYLPTSSLINGVLLSGLDAKASIVGTDENPQPVLVQVKGNAYLPNGYQMDLDQCQLLATGWGDISSERVHLRTNKLICINEEGGVVDIPIDAVATSSVDGKEGLRGRLVSREGKMITKAMVAGFLNGVSSAFKPASAMGATTGGSPFETANLEQAGNIGVASGVGGAMEKLAEYYVSMIGKMSPILEIAPLQEIQFITVEGVLLKWN